MILRPYQLSAIDSARAAVRAGHRRILIQAPTGAGKTVLATEMIRSAVQRFQSRVLVVAHRKELVSQFWGCLYRADIEAGVMRASDERTNPNLPVQVGTIQSLVRRDLPPADLVFVDEAHRCPGDSYQLVLSAYPKVTIFGLTATPCRLDGKPLKEHFDKLVSVASYSELIEQGAIVAPIVYGPARAPDLSKVSKVAGDYNEGQLEAAMMGAHVIGDVVSTWQKRAEGRSTVVFAVGIEHSQAMVEKFQAAGVKAAHLDGTTPEDERDQILVDLELGKLELVSNVGVLCEGWDQPRVKCCVMARPTLSLTLWMQCAGRILRPWGDKQPLILDHSGNVDRHGLPHEDRAWSLDGQAKRARPESELRMCAGCYAYVQKMPCPLCGHEAAREPRKIKVAQGELRRVDRAPSTDPKREFFDAQAESARKKGFKPGYAAARYKEKYGEWPPWAWSQALKADHAADEFWQARVAKRAREREFWQDRQKAAADLAERAAAVESDDSFRWDDL